MYANEVTRNIEDICLNFNKLLFYFCIPNFETDGKLTFHIVKSPCRNNEAFF